VEDPRGFAAEIDARLKRTGLDGHKLIDEIRTKSNKHVKFPQFNDSSKLLARIAALPFNQYLTKDVGQLRRKFKIPTEEVDEEGQRIYLGLWSPEDGEEEHDTLGEICDDAEEIKPSDWVFKFTPDPDPGYKWYVDQMKTCPNNAISFYYVVFYKESAVLPVDEMTVAGFEIPHWRSAWIKIFKQCTMNNLLETKLPIDIEIIELTRKYQLPIFMFYYILDYVLSGRRCDLVYGLILQPNAQWYINELTGEDGITVAVPIQPWDNQDSWNLHWNTVKRAVYQLQMKHRLNEPSTKRASIRSYWKQIVRWAEWFELSEIQGLGPKRALVKWEEKYPDNRGKYDQSTVTKAIRKFIDITSK
jgi:hypothetical protein